MCRALTPSRFRRRCSPLAPCSNCAPGRCSNHLQTEDCDMGEFWEVGTHSRAL